MADFPFMGLLRVLPLGAVLADERGDVVAVNRAFERATGHRDMDVRGRSLLGVLVQSAVGLEGTFSAGVTAGDLDMVLELGPAPGGSRRGGTIRFRSFEHEGRAWVLGTLESTVGPDGRSVVELDALVDRISTTKHALNNLVMGLMGHAEILSGMRDAPAGVRSRGEALLDQCRRLREEIQRLDVKGRKPPRID